MTSWFLGLRSAPEPHQAPPGPPPLPSLVEGPCFPAGRSPGSRALLPCLPLTPLPLRPPPTAVRPHVPTLVWPLLTLSQLRAGRSPCARWGSSLTACSLRAGAPHRGGPAGGTEPGLRVNNAPLPGRGPAAQHGTQDTAGRGRGAEPVPSPDQACAPGGKQSEGDQGPPPRALPDRLGVGVWTRVFACICVSLCVCLHVCLCISVGACGSHFMHVCACVSLCTCVCACALRVCLHSIMHVHVRVRGGLGLCPSAHGSRGQSQTCRPPRATHQHPRPAPPPFPLPP